MLEISRQTIARWKKCTLSSAWVSFAASCKSCAVLSRYSLPRYMCATALGRFWRIYFVAAVGSALPFTTDQVAIGAALLIVAFGVVVLVRKLRRRPSQHVLTAA